MPRDGLSSPSSLDLAGYTGVGLRETEAGRRPRWSHRALLASHHILACPSGSRVRAAPGLPETQSGLCFWTSLVLSEQHPLSAYLPVTILSKRNTLPRAQGCLLQGALWIGGGAGASWRPKRELAATPPPMPSGAIAGGTHFYSRTVAQHNQGSKEMTQGCQPLIPPRLEPFPALSARVNRLIAEVGSGPRVGVVATLPTWQTRSWVLTPRVPPALHFSHVPSVGGHVTALLRTLFPWRPCFCLAM